MRPPAHWHVRRRRGPHPAFTAVAGASVLFLVAVVWLLWPSGGARPSSPLASECAGGASCSQGASGLAYAGDVPPPAILGRAAVVSEEPCGVELYAKNGDLELAPASVTKLVTALVAVEREDLDATVDIDVNSALLVASSGSSVMGLEPGQRLTMRDLLYGLLLPSGNDAAIAIAEEVGGTIDGFVDLMNLKARELELRHSHFANAHGLDQAGHYTSARDLVLIGRAVLAQPTLARIVRTERYQPSWDGPEIWNGNELLSAYPGEVIGVKIGYTEGARQTMVAAVERGGRRLIVTLLGSPARYADVTSLFEWAFAHTSAAC